MNEPKFHPLAAYFPMLPKDEFEELKKSIKNFGLLEPITTLDGMILDGRNRYKACMEVGVTPRYRDFEEADHHPIDFVVAANMLRRHLSPAQKVQIWIDIYGKPEPQINQYSGNDALTAVEAPNVNASPAGEASRPSKNISAERLYSFYP